MKNNDDIHSTDTNEIRHLINRVKQGELDQGDALLIEKLLSILPIRSASVQLLLGMFQSSCHSGGAASYCRFGRRSGRHLEGFEARPGFV
jgi:hypothetical protein